MAANRPDIDWSVLEAEYVSSTISTRELAEKYKISRTSVEYRCTQDKWTDKRAEFKRKTAEGLIKRFRAERVEAGVAAFRRLQDVSERFLAQLEDLAVDEDQLHRHVVSIDPGVQGEKTLRAGNMRGAQAYATALERLANTLEKVYGIPSVRDEHDMAAADEKLALERARDEADREIVVRFEGEAAEDAK